MHKANYRNCLVSRQLVHLMCLILLEIPFAIRQLMPGDRQNIKVYSQVLCFRDSFLFASQALVSTLQAHKRQYDHTEMYAGKKTLKYYTLALEMFICIVHQIRRNFVSCALYTKKKKISITWKYTVMLEGVTSKTEKPHLLCLTHEQLWIFDGE